MQHLPDRLNSNKFSNNITVLNKIAVTVTTDLTSNDISEVGGCYP